MGKHVSLPSWPDEKSYHSALQRAGVEMPDKHHCGCKDQPWWSFTRGTHHFYILPDGRHVAYERCPFATEKIRRARMQRAAERRAANTGGKL